MELRLVSIKTCKAVIARTRLGGDEAISIHEWKLESPHGGYSNLDFFFLRNIYLLLFCRQKCEYLAVCLFGNKSLQVLAFDLIYCCLPVSLCDLILDLHGRRILMHF